MPDTTSKLYKENRAAQLENAAAYERDASGNPIFNLGEIKAPSKPMVMPEVAYKNQSTTDYIGDYSGYLPAAALTPGDVDINSLRAGAQSGTEQMFNAAKRFIPNTILGTIGNLASILDFEDYANIDDEYGNPIETATTGMMDWINEKAPIYRKSPGESFDFTDSGYNWDNISQLANSVGAFALTGFLTGGLLSAAAEAAVGKAGISALQQSAKVRAAGLFNAGKLAEAEIPNYIQKSVAKRLYAAPTVLNAGALNQAESIMEAVPQYEQVYRMKLDQGYSDLEAKKAASEAADVSMSINRINILSNITSAGMFTGARSAIQKLEGSTLRSIGLEAGQEASEEGVNYIAQAESTLKGDQGDKFKYNIPRSLEHLLEPQGLESMMLGAIGGAGNTAAIAYVVPAWDKMRGAVKDLKDAAAINGKKDPTSKINDSLKEMADIHDFITGNHSDEDIDAVIENISLTSIANDLKNSDEGTPNLSNTQQKLNILQSVIDNKDASPLEKQRAQAGIGAINRIMKLAEGENLAGKANANEILGHVVALSDIEEQIKVADAAIEAQRQLPQNWDANGQLNEAIFNEKTKDLQKVKEKLIMAREQVQKSYENEISPAKQSEIKKEKERAAKSAKKKAETQAAENNNDVQTEPLKPAVVKTPAGETATYGKNFVKVDPAIDNTTEIIPTIQHTSGNSIQDEFLNIDKVITDETGAETHVKKVANRARISQPQFEDMTGSPYDIDNPVLHFFKEKSKDGSEDKYYMMAPSVDGKSFEIVNLDKAKNDEDAYAEIIKRITVFNKQRERAQAIPEGESNTKIKLGNRIIDRTVYDTIAQSIEDGEAVDIAATIRGNSVVEEPIITSQEPPKGKEKTPKKSKKDVANIADKIEQSEQEAELMVKSKRKMAVAVNYLGVKYSFVKGSDGEWIMVDAPEGVSEQFLRNSDYNLTKDAKLVLKIADGVVPTIDRDTKGHAKIDDKTGKIKTREISAESASNDNKAYGDPTKEEMPIAIYIETGFDTILVGYLPEHAWLDERNDDNERVHIAPADLSKDKNGEDKIVQDILDIQAVREEFKKQYKNGKKSFSLTTQINDVGAGKIFLLEAFTPMSVAAPNIEEDIRKTTGSSKNMWGFMEGGSAHNVDGEEIPNSIMSTLIDGTPVVMVPTANGMLSPQIGQSNRLGQDLAQSISNAIVLFNSAPNESMDILHELGIKHLTRTKQNLNEKTHLEMRRMGLYKYITTFLNAKEGSDFNVGFVKSGPNKGKFFVAWNFHGKHEVITEGDKLENAKLNSLVAATKEMYINFSKNNLAADYNTEVDNSVVQITDEAGTTKPLAKNMNEFYKANRNVKFKSAGEVKSGETTRGVYFVQPVLSFDLPAISKPKGPKVKIETSDVSAPSSVIIEAPNEIIPSEATSNRRRTVPNVTDSRATATIGGRNITVDLDSEEDSISKICK